MSTTRAGGDLLVVFTSGDRVLLHLLLKGNTADPAGGVADQDDIAAHCGIGRTHVPRALKPLIGDGLVNESQGRAPGRTRRVKVYDLTEKGYQNAVILRNKANETFIEWTDEDGNTHSEHCVDALRRINDRLGSSGLNQIPISLFLTIGREKIGWNDLLFLSSSVRGDSSRTITLPEGWVPITPPEVPEPFLGREEDLGDLDRMIAGSVRSLLSGDIGMGKRSLVAMWASSRSKKVLWLKKGDEDEYTIDAGSFDLLVLMGVPMIDVKSTIISGEVITLTDPRGEEWPDFLSELPLLGIMDGDLEQAGPSLLNLRGLEEGPFITEAVIAGLPEKFAIPFYKASKGSPTALAYLQEMEGATLSSLGTLDMEAAIMSLILGLRSRLL